MDGNLIVTALGQSFLDKLVQNQVEQVVGVPMTVKFTRDDIEGLKGQLKEKLKTQSKNSNKNAEIDLTKHEPFQDFGGYILKRVDENNMTLSIATWDLPNGQKMPEMKSTTPHKRMSKEIVKSTSAFAQDESTKAKFEMVFFKAKQIDDLLATSGADGIRFRRTFCFFNHPNGGHDCWYENLIAEPTPKGLFSLYRESEDTEGEVLTNYAFGFACPPDWETVKFANFALKSNFDRVIGRLVK